MSIRNKQLASGGLKSKLDECRQIIRSFERVTVAFSAGVDSTFLLALSAETLGTENVLAAIGISPSLADRERQAARQLAQEVGVELIEVDTLELSSHDYASNSPKRCFWCKSELFTRINELASQRGFPTVLSGANHDDRGDYRPGLEAGDKLGVRNPLMEAELTKDDIRQASRAMGLSTWDKPAMACLASRVPYGSEITADKLRRIEQAEYVLKDLGFAACRVRDHYPVARIEIPPESFPQVLKYRDKIIRTFKDFGYNYVALDLSGLRSGSMNEVLSEHDRA